MVQIFEAIMLVCFGISWPFNIAKSLRSRTARGKSLLFEVCVLVGYLCGMAGKILSGNMSYTLYFYIADAFMVAVDLALTWVNMRRDQSAAEDKTAL